MQRTLLRITGVVQRQQQHAAAVNLPSTSIFTQQQQQQQHGPFLRCLSSSSGKDTATAVTIQEPTSRQLYIVALRSAIPMIGFGFMDNLVMIQAGEAIDMSLGVTFGLSTMTAAGFGQCISDVAGFTSGGIVDATVAKMKLPQHGLSLEQLDLKSSRAWHTLGGCVGVVTGCLLGMSCLLFMDTDRAERAKKAKELQSIFESILKEGHTLINAGKFILFRILSFFELECGRFENIFCIWFPACGFCTIFGWDCVGIGF